MFASFSCLFLSFVLLPFNTAQPWSSSGPQTAKAPATKSAPPGQLKLTPAQKRGLKLLQKAEAEAQGAQPDVRAYVLWQVSRGYVKVDSQRSARLLGEAFASTLSIDAATQPGCYGPECNQRQWLQGEIIRELRDRNCEQGDLGRIRDLIRQAEPAVRRRQTAELVHCYLQRKDIANARELVAEAAENGSYPYRQASQLMAALSDSGERAAVFSDALRSYTQQSGDNAFGFDDLATMVFRFWRELPTPLVVEAMDDILRKAKDEDENKPQPTGVRLGTVAGDVSTSSIYQYRLFQLMPVIEAVDKSRAESLLNENAEVRGLLHQYPQGLTSLDSKYYGERPMSAGDRPGVRSIGFNTPDNSADGVSDRAAERAEAQLEQRTEQIESEVSKDPRQALTDAQSLPLQGPYGNDDNPRANVLRTVMDAALRSNPGVARDAAAQLAAALELSSLAIQALMLPSIAETYLAMGDADGAMSQIKSLLKLAEKVYASDTDTDDPNLAFIGAWPFDDSVVSHSRARGQNFARRS